MLLIFSVGCARIDKSDSEKQLADSIINKLQTQDQVNLTEQEDQYVKNILTKISNKEELTEYEKKVNEQFGMTSPAKFLPKRTN
jgi:hypothetical protein